MTPEDQHRLLPHLRREALHIRQGNAFVNAVLDTPTVTIIAGKLPGDVRSLRGIPAVARGVPGASPGTRPDTRRIDRD